QRSQPQNRGNHQPTCFTFESHRNPPCVHILIESRCRERHFEIGRTLHLKSESRNRTLDPAPCRVQRDISKFRDLRCRICPISKSISLLPGRQTLRDARSSERRSTRRVRRTGRTSHTRSHSCAILFSRFSRPRPAAFYTFPDPSGSVAASMYADLVLCNT